MESMGIKPIYDVKNGKRVLSLVGSFIDMDRARLEQLKIVVDEYLKAMTAIEESPTLNARTR